MRQECGVKEVKKEPESVGMKQFIQTHVTIFITFFFLFLPHKTLKNRNYFLEILLNST